MNHIKAALLLATCLALRPAAGGILDLKEAVVLAPDSLSASEKKAVIMLLDEVQKRTQIRWTTATQWPADARAVIAVGQAAALRPIVGGLLDRMAPAAEGREGYRVQTVDKAVLVVGNDERGTLFGVGRLLRSLLMERQRVELADTIRVATSPKYRIRGHQIGYRPKVNSYDAWTPAMFEQYVKDMVVFGVNSVELIPPSSDDDDDSPHFPLPKMEMMVEMSRILADYGLDVWIWFPVLAGDYKDPKWAVSAAREWDEVFRKLPRIDTVFVPGGDPGDMPPAALMAVLEKQALSLRRTHPKAQMWVSPQNFDAAWLEDFLNILRAEPPWLNGVVYGPWVRVSLPELRARLPKRYPIRRYPDITHSIHSEYPVPGWDVAYAVTEARETINPRPQDQAKIFRLTSPDSVGFITYSEGVNDDVNKFVWSGLGWDPGVEVSQILREYARYFIGARVEDGFAQGLLALENNWRGPLMANAGVETTLQQFQDMERSATPPMLLNWRFQQALYRAYYDAYVRHRLIYETLLEQQARAKLAEAGRLGSQLAIEQAQRILNQALTRPVSRDLRARILELAEALYQSIRMQLSVDKYKAVAVSRGANLDTVDFPLNNRVWLDMRFSEVRNRTQEPERLQAIGEILNRTNPGPGGFYDDLGNVARQPHLVDEGPGYDKDPGSYKSVRSGWAAFGGALIGRSSLDAISPDGPAKFLQSPMEWWTYAQTRYETPLAMRYGGLDPTASYRVRVVYMTRRGEQLIRLVANGAIEVHPFLPKPHPMKALEFDVPQEATRGGSLRLTWHTEPRQGGFSSSADVAEVFLFRK
jgi:hypothetical protein